MPALFYPSESLPTLFYEICNFVLRNCGLFACRHILYCGSTIGYFAFANDDNKRNVVAVGKLELLVKFRLFGENNATYFLFPKFLGDFDAGAFLVFSKVYESS